MKRLLTSLMRPWVIIALTILANLAIPQGSEASWDNDICWDDEIEAYVPCCSYCVFFCDCDEELLMP
jgi:hypothetical protein